MGRNTKFQLPHHLLQLLRKMKKQALNPIVSLHL